MPFTLSIPYENSENPDEHDTSMQSDLDILHPSTHTTVYTDQLMCRLIRAYIVRKLHKVSFCVLCIIYLVWRKELVQLMQMIFVNVYLFVVIFIPVNVYIIL